MRVAMGVLHFFRDIQFNIFHRTRSPREVARRAGMIEPRFAISRITIGIIITSPG